MGRAATKTDMISAAGSAYKNLNALILEMTAEELAVSFNFTADSKKTEAHWGRDKNLRDILIHLHEWQRLLLHWVKLNRAGKNAAFIPAPYNWKTYGDMNVEFWQRHQDTPLEEALGMLDKSHKEILNLAESFSNEELFSKGIYEWVGGSTLGSYFVSTTASHYDWAMKKLKAHRKNCAK